MPVKKVDYSNLRVFYKNQGTYGQQIYTAYFPILSHNNNKYKDAINKILNFKEL